MAVEQDRDSSQEQENSSDAARHSCVLIVSRARRYYKGFRNAMPINPQ
jgi:hypothetical protein